MGYMAFFYLFPFAIPFVSKSYSMRHFVCDQCAMKRITIQRSILSIRVPVRGIDQEQSTLLSQKIAPTDSSKCQHSWVAIDWAGGGSGRAQWHGRVDYYLGVKMLTEKEPLAEGVVQFAQRTHRDPHQVWNTLIRHFQNSPGEIHSGFVDGLFFNQGDSSWLIRYLEDHYDSFQCE